MKVCVLTSSRADFGIYRPLLYKLNADPFFDLKIVAFGTHLSPTHGETIKEIIENGFDVFEKIKTAPEDDTSEGIAISIGNTINSFAEFWSMNGQEFDIVFCLGDRYEMFAAVSAGIPFQIPFAHIHGGERTLGAIDNVFRHSITLSSRYHFVSTESYANRVSELIESKDNIHFVGALSLDNLKYADLLSVDEFNSKWNIDLSKATILTTFHPETVVLENNINYVRELISAINKLERYQFLVTMPNADTSGNIIREAFINNFTNSSRVHLVESLGSQNYFTAMKYCSFLLGNTSSGIIEAASFGKYVINLGDRQKGRTSGKNVIDVSIQAHKILKAVSKIEHSEKLTNENLYYLDGTADRIIEILKAIPTNDRLSRTYSKS